MSQPGLPVPAPTVTEETREFWEALADGRFMLRRCNLCEAWIWYPRSHCPDCGSLDTSWRQASGRGQIYSYTVVRRSAVPGWTEAVPYVIAYVELEEGPRVMSNVIDCDLETLAIGTSVRVVITAGDDGQSLFRFTLEAEDAAHPRDDPDQRRP